ncbi:MAG: KH domain-containing protein [Pyrinomonadaceae bacterium]|nr:KH domain-containing protein [Pyrinomonadaceae bacterium]
MMKNAVEKIVSALADNKDEVEITETVSEKTTVIEVRVAESDMGRLIGRQGRTIKAIRSLLFFAGQKQGRRFSLNVLEG